MKARDNYSHRCQEYCFLEGNTDIFSWSRFLDYICRFFVIKQNYDKIDLSVDTRPIYAHFISLVSRDFTLSRAHFHQTKAKMATRKNTLENYHKR